MAGRTNTTDKGDGADRVAKGEAVDQLGADVTDFAIFEPPVDRDHAAGPELTDGNLLQLQSPAPTGSAQHPAITNETIEDGGDIGVFGIDWTLTLTLTAGLVNSQDTNSTALSDDADSVDSVTYCSEFQFQDFELIGW